jgi:hypothetical protein
VSEKKVSLACPRRDGGCGNCPISARRARGSDRKCNCRLFYLQSMAPKMARPATKTLKTDWSCPPSARRRAKNRQRATRLSGG